MTTSSLNQNILPICDDMDDDVPISQLLLQLQNENQPTSSAISDEFNKFRASSVKKFENIVKNNQQEYMDDNDAAENIVEEDEQDKEEADEEEADKEEEEETDDGGEETGAEDEETEEVNMQEDDRKVGQKNKKWASKKERDAYYKKRNNCKTIDSRKKVGVVKEYPPIPEEGLVAEGYMISQFARIRLPGGVVTCGSRTERPKIELPHYGGFIVSRLVASSFGLIKNVKDDVDHINSAKPLDNSLSNLQMLSRSDHAKKTHADNPTTGKKIQKSLGKPVLGRRHLSNDEFIEYPSSREAEKATGANSANIRSICNKWLKNTKGVYHCGGFEWKYAERLLGETVPEDVVWKSILGEDKNPTGHYICQYGLVRRRDDYVTRGSLHDNGRYHFNHMQVSIYVALYFLPPPTHSNQTTVNHKDLNPLNNHVSNLEWASDREQLEHAILMNPNRKNRSCVKKCKFRKLDSDEWVICESIQAASNATNVSMRTIRNNFLRDSFTEKGFQFRIIEQPLLPDETFVPLRLYFKEPPKERSAPRHLEMIKKSPFHK